MQAQFADFIFDNFANGNNLGVISGSCAPVYVTGISDAGDAGSGCFMNNFSTGPLQLNAYDCFNGGTPWRITTPVDFSRYIAIQFDILWDTRSGLTIDQWNTGVGFQPGLFNPPGSEPPNFLATNGFMTGLDIKICANGYTMVPDLGSVMIPENAAYGWQTVTVPLPPPLVENLTDGNGIIFGKWIGPGFSSCSTSCSWAFWLDNIVLLKDCCSTPPPTLSPPIAAIPGLNIFNLTEHNAFYDRNEVSATTTSGLTWVGHPGASYSMNLTGFPKNAANGPQAYMFLVPNSAAQDNAPDWYQPSCMTLEVESTPAGAQASLLYKVNSPFAPITNFVNMATGGAISPAVQSSQLLGNYSITFTGNDAGYVTVPDGTTGAFTLNGADGETYFSESGAAPFPFLIYIGGMAIDAAGMDQPVVYGSFAATGVPSGFSETFTGETALSANWINAVTSDTSSDRHGAAHCALLDCMESSR